MKLAFPLSIPNPTKTKLNTKTLQTWSRKCVQITYAELISSTFSCEVG